MSTPLFPGGHEKSAPNDPDGIMNDQVMPTADGQMASNTSEEVVPPSADREVDASSAEGRPGEAPADPAADDGETDDEADDGVDDDEVTLDELP